MCCSSTRPAAWFAFLPRSPKIDREMLEAPAVVRRAAKESGWPSLRAFAPDEAGAPISSAFAGLCCG